MGDPEDDQTPHARAAADAELARQDAAAADSLRQSAENLDSIAATMKEQGYEAAGAIVHQTASQQLDDGVRHASRGELLGDASRDWESSAVSFDKHDKELGQVYVGSAEHLRAEAMLRTPPRTEAEQTDHELAEVGTEARLMGHIANEEMMGDRAGEEVAKAIEMEKQAWAIHPNTPEDAVAAEPPASE